jgi:hypothetical protein
MLLEASKVWEQLIEPTQMGFLKWKSPQSNCFYGSSPDSRTNPIKYLLMSGKQREWNKRVTGPDNSDLKLLQNGIYETNDGVITGVNGLLNVTDMFNMKPEDVDEVLLTGAISDKSLFSTLAWVDWNKWNAHVTLVDISSIPLDHVQTLTDLGAFVESPKFSLLQTDLLRFNPKSKPKIIVGDMCNVWAVPKFVLDGSNPYKSYDQMVNWSSNNLAGNGLFYSRCVIYPESQNNEDLNIKFSAPIEEKAQMVFDQLGKLGNGVNRQWVRESAEDLFDKVHPSTFCGLEHCFPEFVEHPTLEGVKAEEKMRSLHLKHFSQIEEIKILDKKSGATYLNFACRK